MSAAEYRPWQTLSTPVCGCTENRGWFSIILCSVRIPDKFLPGVECRCGATLQSLRTKALHHIPEKFRDKH